MEDFLHDCRSVYNKLQDDLSRYIFRERLSYIMTGDFSSAHNFIFTNPDVVRLRDDLLRYAAAGNKVFCYGAGKRGDSFVRLLCDDVKFSGYIDKNKYETELNGIPVIRLDEAVSYSDKLCVLVSNLKCVDKIVCDLREAGIKHILISNDYEKCSIARQYFDLNALKAEQDEIFVDAGAFDGESTLQFIKWCKGRYKKVYAFEPDSEQFMNCQSAFATHKNIDLIGKGLWDKETNLYIVKNGHCPHISEQEHEYGIGVSVTTIDKVCEGMRVTFIKMDIEGSEYKALCGAEKTIRKYHPKLAISIYHKHEDLWELPSLISKLDDKYKFYLRHYGVKSNCVETVLYGI